MESGSKVVALLHPFSVIQSLIHHHFSLSHIFIVAAPLVLGALPHVKSIVERQSSADGGSKNDALSMKISQNTLRPFVIPSSITARDFHTLFTDENLRWEFIGFIFACAGRSAIIKPANSSIFVKDSGEVVDRDIFCHDMMMASRTCVALCRQNGAVVNDLLIWLLYENLVFSTMHYGDSSISHRSSAFGKTTDGPQVLWFGNVLAISQQTFTQWAFTASLKTLMTHLSSSRNAGERCMQQPTEATRYWLLTSADHPGSPNNIPTSSHLWTLVMRCSWPTAQSCKKFSAL